jgi:hypothetical protein
MATNPPRDPTDEEALALFKAVEDKFPSSTLGTEKWYIVLVCFACLRIAQKLILDCSSPRWLEVASPASHPSSTSC